MEESKEEIHAQVRSLEATVAKLETEKIRAKTKERLKVAAYFKAQFETNLVVDRANTKEASI